MTLLTNRVEEPSVLAIQIGARRGYELARMLEDHNVLTAMHTSAAWHESAPILPLFRLLLGQSIMGAIARRTVVGIPRSKVHVTFLPEIIGKLLDLVGFSDQEKYRAQNWFLGRSARRAGLRGANIVLNTTGNGGVDFLRWTRTQNVRVATDIVITPRVFEVLKEEHRRWPGWENADNLESESALHQQHIEEIVEASDLLLSPSKTVDEGLATVRGFDEKKLVRLPYGLGALKRRTGQPVPKRILFAGQAGLRKGIPYLAEAGRALKPLGYEIRVAGKISNEIRERAECASLDFLGHLAPTQMAREFDHADVFCLPSLAEGMASVTLEALACGVPCVVTNSAGSPVTNGYDGLIVPERDGEAITEAIMCISEDRMTRARMSEAALTTASSHALDVVGQRLLSVLVELTRRDG